MSAAHWTSEALCAQVDPDLFFPEEGTHGIEAKRLCAACPVAEQCDAYAARFPPSELRGIWAGRNVGSRPHTAGHTSRGQVTRT